MNYYSDSRLEWSLEALKKSYSKLKQGITKEDDFEVYIALGESLLWICTTDEWLSKNSRGYNKRKNVNNVVHIISALKYAINSFKHNKLLFKLHQSEGGFEFPGEFPFEIETITFKWCYIEPDEKDFESQIKNYEKYFLGKEISHGIEEAFIFLEKEHFYEKENLSTLK
ncbi:hypothetical protein [Lysinibacillus agricola]|uniref:hypothetical protein n=1 Tax=Lysinibacillus agricola TaxID=2590012 RepID=UPI003C160B17